MRKVYRYLCAFCLLIFCCCPLSVNAEESPTFLFEMSVEGKDVKEVSSGDIIVVDLNLKRTDAEDWYTMYAMQDELCYNSEFLELLDDGITVTDGITYTDIARTDSFREFYVNYLAMNGGVQWKPVSKLASVRFKVIGQSGVSKIISNDFLVSRKDGLDTYFCEANDITIIVSTECTVKFASRGGTEIADQIVQYGEKLTQPEEPIREGYRFTGWYIDIDLTERWNFETDKVQGNMTLYAGWTEADVIESENPITDPVNEQIDICWWWLLLILLLLLLWYYNRKRNRTSK